MNTRGYAALIGAGPGDPGLITVKGAALLANAEVVIYDRLVSSGILEQIPRKAIRLDVGKTSGHHPVRQEEITKRIVEYARAGKRVVRLKGGDPYVFGRGGEEAEALAQAGIPFTVVPGITSAIGAAGYAGIPLTHRDYAASFTVITGHRKKDAPLDLPFQELVELKGTIVFLMGVAHIREITEGLMAAGMDPATPSAMVENGTLGIQRKVVASLATIVEKAEQARIGSPAILVVGAVCSLSERLDWFHNLPLRGRRILVTNPVSPDPDRLEQGLRERGAEVRHEPLIRIQEMEDPATLDAVLDNLENYDWLTFSSGRGVEIFFQKLWACGRDARYLAGCHIAAVGPKTAAVLEKRGIVPDLVPSSYHGEALGRELLEALNGRVLVLEAEQAGRGLTDCLEQHRVPYDRVPLYHTVGQALSSETLQALAAGDYTDIVVTSASAARELHRQVKDCSIRVVCIGKATAAALEEWPGEIRVSGESTYESIIEACMKSNQQGV